MDKEQLRHKIQELMSDGAHRNSDEIAKAIGVYGHQVREAIVGMGYSHSRAYPTPYWQRQEVAPAAPAAPAVPAAPAAPAVQPQPTEVTEMSDEDMTYEEAVAEDGETAQEVEGETEVKPKKKRVNLNPQGAINAKVKAVEAAGGTLSYSRVGRTWTLNLPGHEQKQMTAREFSVLTPETILS